VSRLRTTKLSRFGKNLQIPQNFYTNALDAPPHLL
jgi:hypothetical protein